MESMHEYACTCSKIFRNKLRRILKSDISLKIIENVLLQWSPKSSGISCVEY